MTGNVEFRKDAAKVFLVAAKVLLKMINLWPESKNRFKILTFWVILSVFLYIEIGQVAFIVANTNDIAKLTNDISSISVTLQALTKIVVVFVKSSTLSEMINSVWYEFWPSNVMGDKIGLKIKRKTNIFLYGSYAMYISGIMFSIGLSSIPYLKGLKELPYKVWHPFDWTVSPIYEILYIFHGFVNLYFILNAICGYDFLYFGICLNLTAQFRLSGEALQYLGTEKEGKILDKLLDLDAMKFTTKMNKFEDGHRKLLIICIKHHNKLIKMCNQMNCIFSLGHAVQLATSVAALCVSMILITMAGKDANVHYQIMMYCFGHVSQLFLLCAVSTELTAWSSHLATSLSLSCWYSKNLKNLGSYVNMIIMRSHIGNSITALRMVKLNYTTFIMVLRFSFSLYTFMDNMVK